MGRPARTVAPAISAVPLAADELNAHHLASWRHRLPHIKVVHHGGQPTWQEHKGGVKGRQKLPVSAQASVEVVIKVHG
jgi:hypothetical protein